MHKITISFFCFELILEALSLSLELRWVETESSAWNICDISNPKSGTKTVTLKNATRDELLTTWLNGDYHVVIFL